MRPRYASTPLKIIALTALVVTAVLWLRPAPSAPAPASAATVTIAVGDIWFCDETYAKGVVCDTVVNVGDTVTWDFSGASLPHTTTECGASCDSPSSNPLWDSGAISDGSTFSYTFYTPGTYLYFCEIHASSQRGRIIVQGQPPTRTPPPRPTATPGGRAGDVDCSGSVTSIDAALVLQYNAGLLSSLRCPQNADVNGDGSTNSIDAALVLQYVAGLLSELPP